MRTTTVLRLAWMGLFASVASAVELPIVHITIGPSGAVVERAGVMPAGDDTVDGLPLGIDPARLTVTIEGLATPPAIRLDLPKAPPAPVPEAAWKTRLTEAQAAFDLAQPTIELAEQRIRLSRAVLRLMPGSTESATEPSSVVQRPDTATQPVPAAAIQQGLLRFVSTNRELAERDILAARRARAEARQRLIALDEELERQRIPARLTSRLPLPGSAGRPVRLTYTVERAAWAPVYTVEVRNGICTLVREALIDVPRDQQWTSGRLELITRSPADDLVLKDLQVPVLELGDEVVARRAGGRLRALAKGGGSRASESSVDAGLRSGKSLQLSDGSWSSGAGEAMRSSSRSSSSSGSATAATALMVLTYLGAGYDHKTPNKYKATVVAGISWLSQHQAASDLSSQALVTCALAEAFAMTNDPELKEPVEHALHLLAERVVTRNELDVVLYRRGPLVGPEALGWVTLAAKSALAAGITDEARSIMAVTKSMLPELLGHADRDEAAVVRLMVSAFTGIHVLREQDQPAVSDWLERANAWWREGRPELVYFATMGLFQYGGGGWQLWNGTIRDRLVQLQTLGERSGYLAATPHPHGEAMALAFVVLPMEVYYRYQQVSDARGSMFGNRKREDTIEPLPPLASLASAALSWPVRFDVGPAHLVDGQRMRVQIGRTVLPGRLGLRTVPTADAGAWRVLTTTNPLSVPLLVGDGEVVVDGERLGRLSVPFTEPGARLELGLGRDDRVQVVRSEERTDDEAWGKRTRTHTVRVRVDAPPGIYDAIRIDEAMPVPQDARIQLVSQEPTIPSEQLDRRLIEDPVWHIDLDLRKPPAVATIAWQLRFPAQVRPRVDSKRPEQEDANAEENEAEVIINASDIPSKGKP